MERYGSLLMNCVWYHISSFKNASNTKAKQISDNYECICLRGCMSMYAEEVYVYDCTSMHVERAEIIEHSPFVPPITHPTINYQHHLNSGVDS